MSPILKRSSRPVALALALLIAALACSMLLVGCGNSTPDSAMRKFLAAWQASDWEAYKSSVAPADRNLSKDQEDLAKQKFDQVKVKFADVQTKTDLDAKDKNKAAVTLTGGKVTITAPILGENKTQTRDIAPKKGSSQEPMKWSMVKVNGVWYVDMPLGL
jgi:hypothetical protein